MPLAGKLREHLHFIFEECSILVGFFALRLRYFQQLEDAQLSCLRIAGAIDDSKLAFPESILVLIYLKIFYDLISDISEL